MSSSRSPSTAKLTCLALSLTLMAAGIGCQTTVSNVDPRAGAASPPTRSRATVDRPKPAVVTDGSSGGGSAGGGATTVTMPPKPFQNTGDALDPCAERLHAVCGSLLTYYFEHRQLPPTLQDLTDAPDEPLPPLVCPTSHQPYVYLAKNPILIDNPRGYIILHDATPAHDGVRWCIVVSSGTKPNEPMVAKAIGIKEERFAVLRSKALSQQPDAASPPATTPKK